MGVMSLLEVDETLGWLGNGDRSGRDFKAI